MNIKNKFPKPQASSKEKTTYSGIWEQGHGFPPHISEAYLKNINKCFRIFRMFSSTSNTQKNQAKPQNSIAFFFRIEPRSCAARDFGMLSYSKLCKGLTKTSWIFSTQPRWIGRLSFDSVQNSGVLSCFFKAKILSSFCKSMLNHSENNFRIKIWG